MFGNLFFQRKEEKGEVSNKSSYEEAGKLQAQQIQSQEERDIISSKINPSTRQNISSLTSLDSRSTQVLNHAQEETKRIKQAIIESEQILFGLLYDREIFRLLEEFGVDSAALAREIQGKASTGSFTGQPNLSERSQRIFEEAYKNARNRGSSFITPEDLLISLFQETTPGALLRSQGLKKESIEEKLSKEGLYAGSKKSFLERFGTDLTELAKKGVLDPVVGRNREIERLIHILLRRTKNNPVIIGEAGVGKTAIVEALAHKIVEGNVPTALSKKRIIQLEISSLIAGATHRGEFEERLRNVIREAQVASGEIILFVDEVHTIIGAGGAEGSLDASDIIKPYLARGQLQIIGTTTTAEYRKHFEKDRAFERRFQPILVEEPSEEIAIEMLNALKLKYENFHKVEILDEAIEAAVHLSKRYIGERFLPDKAVDLIDESAAEVKLGFEGKKKTDNKVTKSDIEKVVSSWTGIPVTRLTEDESQKLLNLEKLIHNRLIDQEEAVSAVAEAVRRGRIGLSATTRPIASFIFLGPTGVGKTETAKTLAEILFGREDAMIRIDMSEFMEKHEVAKFIGAPPGYVGYEEGGRLTEAVRTKPYSIVLLDEIEKAHPDVFNILLQVLEDGRLTDNKGNTISFKNTIIIATSNIGSTLIQKRLSEALESNEKVDKEFKELTSTLLEELHKFFHPELLNRFDEVVIFKPLALTEMLSIARLGVGRTKKLLEEQGFELEIKDSALEVLSQEGYDPVYGARPLRRLIQNSIENPISLLIIGKTFMAGDKIIIDYNKEKGEFTFTKAVTVEQQPAQGLPQEQTFIQTHAPIIEQPTTPQTPSSSPQPGPIGFGGEGQALQQTEGANVPTQDTAQPQGTA